MPPSLILLLLFLTFSEAYLNLTQISKTFSAISIIIVSSPISQDSGGWWIFFVGMESARGGGYNWHITTEMNAKGK